MKKSQPLSAIVWLPLVILLSLFLGRLEDGLKVLPEAIQAWPMKNGQKTTPGLIEQHSLSGLNQETSRQNSSTPGLKRKTHCKYNQIKERDIQGK